MTPEANEQDKNPDLRKQISLTSQENLTLMMADPESAEVKAIMDAHGIEFGDPVEANVDGVRMIVDTSKGDFWTRDRKATEALGRDETSFEQVAADHAQNLMETDPITDLEVDETPEVDEELREEVSDDLGKEAVEEVEQETQQAESSQEAMGMKAEYDRRVDVLLDQQVVTEINDGLRRLEEETLHVANSVRPLRLQDASEQLRATIASIENDSYGVEAARAKLSGIEKELVVVDGQLRAAAEDGLSSAKGVAERLKKHMDDVGKELENMQDDYVHVIAGEQIDVGPDADTGKIRAELSAVSADFEQFATGLEENRPTLEESSRMLRVVIGHLSEFIRQSYSGRIDSSELHSMYASVLNIVEQVSSLDIVKKFDPLAETSNAHLAAIAAQRER